jgi:endoglucanase
MTSPRTKGENPFAGVYFFIDPESNANRQVRKWSGRSDRAGDLIKKIADHPTAAWFGDWTPAIGVTVDRYVHSHERFDALPVFVLYNVPNRDCGQYSKGGATGPARYKHWIDEVKRGIGNRRAVAVLEPDALPMIDKCLGPADQEARLDMIRYAVHEIESLPGAAVYIDAGHDAWRPVEEIANLLLRAGIEEATGFSLNTSNYRATPGLIAYGHEVSKRVGGKHFIIDTGRNGNGGPTDANGKDLQGEAAWCNPAGRALGTPPTTDTGDPLIDAFYWVKPPGESDGKCNGGPSAGVWWPEYALGLARRAKW